MIAHTSQNNIAVLVGSDLIQVSVDLNMIPHFKTLVQRALNTWPDAPPELKEFADLLLEGKVLQDYHSQV
jgi:hypothetical protein